MSNTVIDQKTEKHSYGFWKAKETVATTISLINMGDGNFGLSYDSSFDGMKSGHVTGGPYEVTGNMKKVVHDSPQVTLNISNYDKTDSNISMSVAITVDIPVIGNETIYNETLSGPYTATAGWAPVMANLAVKLQD